MIIKGVAYPKITKAFRLKRSNTNLWVTENQEVVIKCYPLFIFYHMVDLFIPGSHQESISLFSSIRIKALLTVGSNDFAVNCFDNQH